MSNSSWALRRIRSLGLHPERRPSGIVVPLGPKGGATYAPGWDQILDAVSVSQLRQRAAARGDGLLDLDILDAEATMQIKSADLMVDWYAHLLGRS